MNVPSGLSREQKEAIGLLQIGTFLEYFDLMLYVHMAVLLNELFFPKADPHTTALLSAFAFCSTFVFRPFGALIFGYIGDHIGRKATVIITTTMMSISCVIMANLPTYAQVGISASWLITMCRVIQGMSSMGEITGAQIYVTEITKPPVQYPAVAFIGVASDIGAMTALGISVLSTRIGFNWRIAFWIGAAIAVVGSIARMRLRETPEFVHIKKLKQRNIEEKYRDKNARSLKTSEFEEFIKRQKVDKKTLTAYFFIQCAWPFSFYLTFIYMNLTLKQVYGYSAENVIFHNFLLAVIGCVSVILWSLLSSKYHPLKILSFRSTIFILFSLIFPVLLSHSTDPHFVFLWQAILIFFFLGDLPGTSVFISSFPVLRRFSTVSFVFAVTRALMYVFTSFGLVYLTEWYGHYGLWIIILPLATAYLWGIRHYEKLENI
jgi:MFS transporter, MHS family, proline/betaine transporter